MECELKRDWLAGGIEDAIIAAVGLDATLTEHLDGDGVNGLVGKRCRYLDDSASCPAAEMPGIGSHSGRSERQASGKHEKRGSHHNQPLLYWQPVLLKKINVGELDQIF